MRTFQTFRSTINMGECGEWDINVDYWATNNDAHKAEFEWATERWDVDIEINTIFLMNEYSERNNNKDGINEALPGHLINEQIIDNLKEEAKKHYIKDFASCQVAAA